MMPPVLWVLLFRLGVQLFEVQDFLYSSALPKDLLLKQRQGVDQLFRARRAAGDIYIYGNNLIHPLDQGVIIENSPGGSAGAHGNNPFGFWHLVINSL